VTIVLTEWWSLALYLAVCMTMGTVVAAQSENIRKTHLQRSHFASLFDCVYSFFLIQRSLGKSDEVGRDSQLSTVLSSVDGEAPFNAFINL
jgi:hypothetical protein